jgi:hypothetical protein
MNAVSSAQWSDTIILKWNGMAQWKLLSDLINLNNTYYSQSVQVNQDTNGQFTVASLTTGSGDTAKYFYRILSVAMPATPQAQVQFFYRQSNYQDFPNPQPNTSLPYVWYRLGDVIQILPVAAGQGMAIQVNYRPPRIDQLSTTSIPITFPTGYEELISWWAASMALIKGGNEADAAAVIRQNAEEQRDNFLQDLGRQGTWPILARAHDTPDMWGS